MGLKSGRLDGASRRLKTPIVTHTDQVGEENMGGTLRLGAQATKLKAGTKIAEIYACEEISERHRNRYGVNAAYF